MRQEDFDTAYATLRSNEDIKKRLEAHAVVLSGRMGDGAKLNAIGDAVRDICKALAR